MSYGSEQWSKMREVDSFVSVRVVEGLFKVIGRKAQVGFFLLFCILKPYPFVDQQAFVENIISNI